MGNLLPEIPGGLGCCQGDSVVVYSLFADALIGCRNFFAGSLFYHVVLGAIFSLVIILRMKRELVALL